MLYMGLEAYTAIIWRGPQLQVLQTMIRRVNTKQIEDISVRLWDASATNFVLISNNIEMHAELTYDILRQHRYCNLEMVEQIMTAAGC